MTSTQARADDVYQPKNFLPCKVYRLADGRDVCGFLDIGDWKKVLGADAELEHVRNQLKNEQARSAALAEQKSLMLGELSAFSSSQATLVAHSEKLTRDLIALDKKYQTERVKPRFGSPVAWTIAAVSTAILAGFVISSALD